MKTIFAGWGAQWTPTVIFGVLVIVMVFKPSGLFGDHTPEKV
jgi:branched-subunit amino acid ABC-type transport system permease component